ncbi:TRAF3-interacting protein 1 isoform X1 [Amyelois transitella]|uniref:TRAF3-interacting protein 1 isoform X1 n=1 Tax=Amyelois transitella TaxID=680683 RepID=UPI00299026B5|nr:TRAF3-interacting protein 1 isoform X1 [Amyelois transitella]
MEKDLDLNIIKATQTSLGKFVKRPPLSEKLLRKPPFRFLHDIVTTVLKSTGFFKGLFEPEELISDNVKDRDSKILFLSKVISVVGFATGKSLTIKPSKIVAGQEADKTNELLQALALALEKKISSDEAVRQYKENGNVQQVPTEKKIKESAKSVREKEKKVLDSKKLTSRSNEKLTANKKDSERKNNTNAKNISDGKSTTKTNQKENIKKESPTKTNSQQNKNTTKEVAEKKGTQLENTDKNFKDKALSKYSIDNNIKDLNSGLLGEIVFKNNELSETTDGREIKLPSTVENQLNSSLSTKDFMEVECKQPEIGETAENHTNNNEKLQNSNISDDLNPAVDILDSSLKNSVEKNEDTKYSSKNDIDHYAEYNLHQNDKNTNDTVKDITNEVEEVPKTPEKSDKILKTRPQSVRPSSSRPGAPRLRDKHDNIITENENLIVGKVNIIVEHAALEEEEDSSLIIIEPEKVSLPIQDDQEQFQLSTKPHGHLVHQILDSQKEFSKVAGKTEIEWEFGAQKAREAVNKEIEELRYNFQGLSRVANPLGKILDHIQEDVEVMRQELQQWTQTYDEASKELLKQKTLNEGSLLPLRAKGKQLEVDINEKYEKINDLKVAIHKNSSRIEKLLASGNVQ